MGKKDQRGYSGLDPDVKTWAASAARNRAARSKRQVKDDKRIRIKLDIPEPIKDALTATAIDLGASVSQLAGWLIADALLTYYASDEPIPLTPSRSPAIKCNVDFTQIVPALTKAARAYFSADQTPQAGTEGGTKEGTVDKTQ